MSALSKVLLIVASCGLFFAQSASAEYRFSNNPDATSADVNGDLFTNNVQAGSYAEGASNPAAGSDSTDGSVDSGPYMVEIGGNDSSANTPDNSSDPNPQFVLDSTTSIETGAVASAGGGSFANVEGVGFGIAPEPGTFGLIGFALCGAGFLLRRRP